MGKHVCPVCEDVYAVQATVDVRQDSRSTEAAGWACPSCGYAFLGTDEVGHLLEWAVQPYAPGSTSVCEQLPPGATVVSRLQDIAASPVTA